MQDIPTKFSGTPCYVINYTNAVRAQGYPELHPNTGMSRQFIKQFSFT